MNNPELFYRLFSLITSISNLDNDPYDYIMMMDNEKLMGYSVSLVGEIDELLNKGYTYDEIKDIIMTCDFVKNDPELTNEEGEFLRKDALRILNIRYKIYLEDKNIKKKIK